MNPLLARLQANRLALTEAGLWRRRRLWAPALIDFSANDYLGLAREPQLAAALAEGANRFGVGSRASALVSGYSPAHEALEQELCRVTGHEAALLFCSGFAANLALAATLLQAGDTLIADKYIHASVIDGVQASGAALRRFPHNDLDGAARLLGKYPGTALWTESIFSMDGDGAPLAQLARLCREHNSLLIVDDAHGFGVIGEEGMGASRLPEFTRSAGEPGIDIQLVTFGKALGAQGAAILGSKALIDSLVACARHYIYSTALSPAQAFCVSEAIRLAAGSDARARLFDNINYFRRGAQALGLELLDSASAIQLLPMADVPSCMAAAEQLRQQGVLVGAIRPPTVPSPRLRITLSAGHSRPQLDALLAALAQLPAATLGSPEVQP
ncbi:aminotransferase class I/II-fold pyridoxal phosphate-dependent enzyme [Shewanella cyperi]|uniref:aminotransferase class I/II-fold pyridoxal phosphate-dependent enzyme n=1 Tax=Shewanella cyperi TaxID=2814292 RepID=UPI001A93B126|nr:8-amino-7-oxononanoate synthase [Shewanella cyperi]QSX42144.1 8-amino-7-oxononanoate synthase [Shewanella cyperi]